MAYYYITYEETLWDDNMTGVPVWNKHSAMIDTVPMAWLKKAVDFRKDQGFTLKIRLLFALEISQHHYDELCNNEGLVG